MADDVERKIIYLEVNATKAVDGSTAATNALAAVGKSASSAGAALDALEAASAAVGGAASKSALDLATAATAAANLNAAYRTTTGGVLELTKATNSAASSAAAQAAGFARMADQRAAQASLAETRALMDSVARSSDNLAHVYGAATGTVKTLAQMQARDVSAAYDTMAASAARYAAGVEKTVQQAKVAEAYEASLRPVAQYGAAAPAAARAPLTAFQKTQLGYQFNDIFTQLAGGANPALIAAQQGPQITQVFGGLRNTIAAIPTPVLAAGGGILAGLGIAAAISSLKDLSDTLDAQKRKLGDMLGDQRLSAQAYADIGRQATAANESIAQATATFTQFSRATASIGATIGQTVSLTSIVGQLGRLGGASPEEQAAGSSALANVLRESVVSASNLDAILENMPGLGRRIADGLGISVTQLRLMADQGQVTNRLVFDALLSQQAKVSANFKEAGITVGGFFSAAIRDAENLAVSLYKSVTNLQLVVSKADAAKRAAAANPTRPTAATPRVIGNNGSSLSLEDMITSGESGQFDDSASQLQTQWEDFANAAKKAADEAVLAASKIADGLDPAVAEMRNLQQQTDAATRGLTALQSGLTTYDTSTATQETKKLTDGLQALREKADAAGGSYLQAIKALQLRQDQDEISREATGSNSTPGQRATAASVQQFAAPGSGVSIDDAKAVVSQQQLQMLDDLIAKQGFELTTQTAITAAMRNGKKAADDAAVAMQILGISFEQLGTISPELQVKLDILADTLEKLGDQKRLQGTIDASKPLIAQLDGIAAAMENVTKGAYLMKLAQAQAMAAHNENGTGGLELEVFQQQQNLTDLTLIENLKKQVELTNDLAAAAGNIASQKKVQLDYDIRIAKESAGSTTYEAEIEVQMRAKALADQNKLVADGLADQQRSNDLLQQQLDIIRQGSPDQAAQLAMLQKRYDLVSKGLPLDQASIDAAATQARLQEQIQFAKDAADATKRTWQNAYDNIQSSAADTFYDIFSGAGFNAQSAAQAMKNIFLHAFAEIAAAAIIRPIISPIFQLGESAGLIPAGVVPGATGSVGGGGGGIGGLGTGGGLGSIFSSGGGSGGGWLARQFSGIGDFLGSPVSGMFSSAPAQVATSAFTGTSAAATGVTYSSVGDLLSSGTTGASAAATGGLSIGGALGGIGSIGMGAYGLLNGKGGTASTIGSIGQIAGGVMMMIPGLQPFGAALSLLSGIVPGLFGGGPEIPPMPGLAYGAGQFRPTSTGSYDYTGDALGSGTALTSGAQAIATSLTTAFRTAGLTVVPGSLIGGAIASGTAHLWSGKEWSDAPYTQTGLVNPDGSYTSLTADDTSRTPDQASQYLLTQAFKANVLQGGVSGAGAGLKAGLDKIDPQTTDALNSVIALGTAYDQLGKTVNPAKDALDKINASFDDLKTFATQAGLSLDPINAELKKQSVRSAQDFIDGMLDPLAVQMRALDDAKDQALASAQYIRDNIKGVAVDTNAIVDYYGKQRVALEDQYYGGAISNLKTLLDQLRPGGNLSNLDPSGQLAGLKSTYETTLAGARSGDATDITNLANAASNYATYSQSYFAGSSEYTAIRDQIAAALTEFRADLQGGTTSSTSGGVSTGTSPAVADLLAQIKQLMAVVQQQQQQFADLAASTTKQNNLTSRLLTTRT